MTSASAGKRQAHVGQVHEFNVTPVLNGFIVRVVTHTGAHHFVIQAERGGPEAIEPVIDLLREVYTEHTKET